MRSVERALGPLAKPFSTTTEYLDLVDCLHKALPERYQAPKLRYKNANGDTKLARISFKRKLEYVYKNIEHLDAAAAFDCHMENAIKDRIQAALSRKASRAYGKATGRDFGIGIGPAL